MMVRPSEKWERRDKKVRRRRHGMRIDGRGVLLLEHIIQKKAEKAKRRESNGNSR